MDGIDAVSTWSVDKTAPEFGEAYRKANAWPIRPEEELRSADRSLAAPPTAVDEAELCEE